MRRGARRAQVAGDDLAHHRLVVDHEHARGRGASVAPSRRRQYDRAGGGRPGAAQSFASVPRSVRPPCRRGRTVGAWLWRPRSATGAERRRRTDPSAPSAAPVDGALAGVVAAGVALGVSELVCGIAGSRPSLISAVGTQFIDRFAARSRTSRSSLFGTNDKVALVVGIVVVSLALGAVLGKASVRRPWSASPGSSRSAPSGCSRTSTTRSARRRRRRRRGARRRRRHRHAVRACCACSGSATARRRRHVGGDPASRGGCSSSRPARSPRWPPARPCSGAGSDERRRRLGPRASTVLPTPADVDAGPGAVAGRVPASPGLTPYVTPNADFYRIDTALVVPQVDVADWTLTIDGHGRPAVRADLRRARGDGRRRGHRHVAVRVQRGRRQPRRQRRVAGRAAGDAARPGRRAERGDADRRPLRRRLHGRLPDRGRSRRAHRARRRRHERRAAAGRARLPGPARRRRPLRLRVGDEVARRHRADDVGGLRRLLGAAGLVQGGTDQDGVAHRRPAQRRHRGRRAAGRSPAWRGQPTLGIASGRGAGRRRRRGARRTLGDVDERQHVGAVVPGVGRRRRASTASGCGRRTPPARRRPRSGRRRRPTARPAGTRARSTSAESDAGGRRSRRRAGVGRALFRDLPWRGTRDPGGSSSPR